VIYYAIKLLISATLIVVISEISKRSSFVGGLIASLPLVSILAFIWLYIDTKSAEKISALSYSIFWLVLPSLSLFIALPWLLRRTENFYLSLGGAIIVMLTVYFLMVVVLKRFDVEL
jgi:hypothetical protein